MGWLFTPLGKTELIHQLTRSSETPETSAQVIAFRMGKEALWSVVQVTARQEGAIEGLHADESVRFIRCDLLDCVDGKWGYKPLEESMHPYYFDCPLEFLDMAPVSCQAWRDEVCKRMNA